MKDQPASRTPDIPVLTPPPPYPAPRGGGRAWLALLVALGAAGGTGWMWLAFERMQSEVAELRSRPIEWPGAAALQTGLAESRQAIAAADARAASLEKTQRELRETVDAAERELRSSRQDIAEAEYLERLAAQSLLMGREVRGALALLEAADEILRQRDDPAFHDARARLAEDIAALRGLAGFDAEGLYLRLAALTASIPALGFTEPHLPAAPTASDAPAAASEPADLLARAGALLERYVVIRHDAPSARPTLPLAEEQLLRMNLRLVLEQAKLGLLSGEQRVYAGALADAAELVRGQFGAEPAANRSFLDETVRLAGESVAPDLPDLADSLRALRAAAQTIGQEG